MEKFFKKTFEGLFAISVVAFYALIIALVFGWFANIYKLVFGVEEATRTLALRFIGIVLAPLGGVMGWM